MLKNNKKNVKHFVIVIDFGYFSVNDKMLAKIQFIAPFLYDFVNFSAIIKNVWEKC